MMLMFASCSLTDRLETASKAKGKIAAGVNLPARPEELAKQELHAPLVPGAELRSILVNERAALNRANARNNRWDLFYRDVQTNYGAAVKGN